MSNAMPTRSRQITDYVARLETIKAQEHHQNKEIGDQWRTPDWLFYGVDAFVGAGRIKLDLFTDGIINSKCANYYTANDNALVQDWAATLFDLGDDAMAYANPPYSIASAEDGQPITGMVHIMRKAWEERNAGAKTVWVVKSATSETWWPVITEEVKTIAAVTGMDLSQIPQADRIIHIQGRISFERPAWFKPGPGCKKAVGAGFGATILIFDKTLPPVPGDLYVHREHLKSLGEHRLTEVQREIDLAMEEI